MNDKKGINYSVKVILSCQELVAQLKNFHLSNIIQLLFLLLLLASPRLLLNLCEIKYKRHTINEKSLTVGISDNYKSLTVG